MNYLCSLIRKALVLGLVAGTRIRRKLLFDLLYTLLIFVSEHLIDGSKIVFGRS